LALQISVVGLDQFSEVSSADPANLTDLKKHKNFSFIEGSMTSADLVRFIFNSHKVDTVVLLHNDNYDKRHRADMFGNTFPLTQVLAMSGGRVARNTSKSIKIVQSS
jgi:dTDP-D-glucose 4,6-dehydratase